MELVPLTIVFCVVAFFLGVAVGQSYDLIRSKFRRSGRPSNGREKIARHLREIDQIEIGSTRYQVPIPPEPRHRVSV